MKYINTAIKYPGIKYNLLHLINTIIKNNNKTFIDLFCGSGVVGINQNNENIILNDVNKYSIIFIEYFKNNDFNYIINKLDELNNKYNLINKDKNGFNKAKNDFNNTKNMEILILLSNYCWRSNIKIDKKDNLIISSFFHKSTNLSNKYKSKIKDFCEVLNNKNIILENKEYDELYIPNNSFVFCDPPYRLAQANYNIELGWNQHSDKKLIDFLDHLWYDRGIPFAMTNIFDHDGLINKVIYDWAASYHVHPLRTYKGRKEVLITPPNLT